jgi:hypothetical protein
MGTTNWLVAAIDHEAKSLFPDYPVHLSFLERLRLHINLNESD